MNLVLQIFVALLFISGLDARYNPWKDPNICGKPSCKDIFLPKFKYGPTLKQIYEYTVDINTLFLGTSVNASKLHVTSKVHFDWLSSCEGQLIFTEVKLKEKPDIYDRVEDIDIESALHEKNTEFSVAIEKFPLRFSFDDGKISELCPNPEEPSWVLNFKRGLLTLFHNSLERLDVDHFTIEMDVHGECPTTYKLQGAHGTSLVIEKTKDLKKCEKRSKIESSVQTEPYSFRKNYEILPLVDSKLECTLSIDHHVYNSIECRETHIFQPFTNEKNSGATSKTVQKVRLLSEDSGEQVDSETIEKRTTLFFDHDLTLKPTTGELKSARAIIKKLCDLEDNRENQDFSGLFRKYIHSARMISFTALNLLYLKVGSVCKTGRKHFLDALPYLGSSASVELMKNLILKEKVPKEVVDDWLLSFALIPRPTEKMLQTFSQLLERYPENTTVALVVSAATNSFCKNKENCQDYKEFQNLLHIFEKRIVENYENQNSEILLSSLKAIGNIGIKTESLEEILFKLIEDKNISTEVRLEAIYAFRRFPCQETVSNFTEILRNQNLDSEIRIAAYLQVMRCPGYQNIEVIRHCLENEEVNQVGAFIWTHLTNLKKSSSPQNLEIQAILYDKDISKKFNTDLRRFSNFFENSVFFNKYNFGGSYLGHLIYSKNSYLPKTALFNFTTNIFGQNINVFEIQGRFEGLEFYFERLFKDLAPIFQNFFQEKSSEFDVIDKNNSISRFIAKDKSKSQKSNFHSENLKNEVLKFPNFLKNNFNDPKISLGLKIFGNEINFKTFNGDIEILEALQKISPIEKIKNFFSGRDILFEKASMFLDSSLITPTGTGFPLVLNAIGTNGINLKAKGRILGKDFMRDHNLEVFGNLKPSVNLNIMGTMAIDAYYAGTGIKIKTNMHTSTDVEGHVKISTPYHVRVNFTLPQEKSEIFSVSSELIVMNNREEEVQKDVGPKISDTKCYWNETFDYFGLKVCSHYSVPKMKNTFRGVNIFEGPVKANISLTKFDTTAKNYIFEFDWTKKNNISEILGVFKTPNSKIGKNVYSQFIFEHLNKNMSLVLRTNDTNIVSKGHFKNEAAEKNFYFDIVTNGKKNLDFGVSLSKKSVKNGEVFIPRMYIAIDNERISELNGTVKSILKVLHATHHIDIDLQVKFKEILAKIFGFVIRTPKSYSHSLNATYSVKNSPEETVNFDYEMIDKTSNLIKNYEYKTKIISSEFQTFNTDLGAKILVSPDRADYNFNISYGKNYNDPNRILNLRYLFLNAKKSDGRKMTSSISAARIYDNIDWKVQYIFDQSGPSVNTIWAIQCATNKTIVTDYYLYTPRSSLVFFETKLNISIPDYNDIFLEGKVHEKISKEYDIDLKGQWINGYKLNFKCLYHDRSTALMANHYLKFLVQSNQFEDVNSVVFYFQNETNFKFESVSHHKEKEYTFILKNYMKNNRNVFTVAELKLDDKFYSVNSALTFEEYSQLLLEFHIDKWKDIHVKLKGKNEPKNQEVHFEVIWDANTVFVQRLITSLVFHIPSPEIYDLKFDLAYPGRNFKNYIEFYPRNYKFNTFSFVKWGFSDFIQINTTFDNDFKKSIFLDFDSKILSSIPKWEKVKIYSGFKLEERTFVTRHGIDWEKDYFSLNFHGDYLNSDNFLANINASILSTLKDIPSLETEIRHLHNKNKIDTSAILTYDIKKVLKIESLFENTDDEISKYISGKINIENAFGGPKNILFVTKFYGSSEHHVKGLVTLDLDLRQYMASMKGHWKKITDNMLVLNFTTPHSDQNYNLKMGLSLKNRHIVYFIRTPKKSLGFEFLGNVNALDDFYIKFNIATPFEFLNELHFIGKYKHESIDFRAGLNEIQLGFAADWHFVNLFEFDYGIKIFTPIKGYYESALTLKLILENGIDSEFTIKFLDFSKIGVVFQIKPKNNVAKELGFQEFGINEDSNDDAEDLEDLENVLATSTDVFWIGFLEIDSYFYPTIKANFDLEKKGTRNEFWGVLKIPKIGTIEIFENFDLKNSATFSNDLKILTPYSNFKEIKSTAFFELEKTEKNLKCDLLVNINILKNQKWIEMGLESYFSQITKDEGTKAFFETLKIKTPFVISPEIKIFSNLEQTQNGFKLILDFDEKNTQISTYFQGAVSGKNFDAALETEIKSQIFNLPLTKFKIMRNNTDLEDILNFELVSAPEKHFKKHFAQFSWNIATVKNFEIYFQSELPFGPLEHVYMKLGVDAVNKEKRGNLTLTVMHNKIDAKTFLDHNTTSFNILSDILNEKYAIDFYGVLLGPEEKKDLRGLEGTLYYKNSNQNETIISDVTGTFFDIEEVPKSAKIFIKPKTNFEQIDFEYQFDKTGDSTGKITGKITQGAYFSKILGTFGTRDLFDWEIVGKIESNFEDYKNFSVNSKMLVSNLDNMTFSFEGGTPFKGLEVTKIGYTYLKSGNYGVLGFYHQFSEFLGQFKLNWKFQFFENLNLKIFLNQNFAKNIRQNILGDLFYTNEKNNFEKLRLGANFNIDKSDLVFGTNFSMDILPNFKNLEFTFKHPNENRTHIFQNQHKMKTLASERRQMEIFSKYFMEGTEILYEISSEVIFLSLMNLDGNLKFINGKIDKSYENALILKKSREDFEILYKLKTPHYTSETFKSDYYWKFGNKTSQMNLRLYAPENSNILDMDLNFGGLGNLILNLNFSTPSKTLGYLGTKVKLETDINHYERYVELFWPDNTALYDHKCDHKIQYTNLENANGVITIKFPIKSVHNFKINYQYDEKPQFTLGEAEIGYNGEKISDIAYEKNLESRAGRDREITKIEFQNTDFTPLGVIYEYNFEYSAMGDGTNLPSTDFRKVQLFNLGNSNLFNMTGEFEIFSNISGDKLSLKAFHKDKLLHFLYDYDIIDQTFYQTSSLQFLPKLDVNFDIVLVNYTENELSEAQRIKMDFGTPLRNFSILGYYNATNTSLASDIKFLWNSEDKSDQSHSLEGALNWNHLEENQHNFEIIFKHPKFEKDTKLSGSIDLEKNLKKLNFELDYSTDPDEKLTFSSAFGNPEFLKYFYNISTYHPGTSLELDLHGNLYYAIDSKKIVGKHDAGYKRKFFAREFGNIDLLFDLGGQNFEYKKETRISSALIKALFEGVYPWYRVKSHKKYNDEIYENGDFYINFDSKLAQVVYNYTEDGSQNFILKGEIPDSRSAYFEVHRNYDDIRLDDILYHLRLYHSRLVVSSLKWRPELKNEIRTNILNAIIYFYGNLTETLDYWKKYSRYEIMEELTDIYENARPGLEPILDDIKALNVLKTDLEFFENFLNESFYENHFYVNDFSKKGYEFLDALSRKSKNNTYPILVNEIFDFLGDSGKSLWKNFEILKEKCKSSYENMVSNLSEILATDLWEQLRSSLENSFTDFDKMYDKYYKMAIDFLNSTVLQISDIFARKKGEIIEKFAPVVLETTKHIGTAIYRGINDFMDYIGSKIQELIETPYFVKMTQILSYFDHIYQDYRNNDIFTFVYKYTILISNWISENIIPEFNFAKKLEDLKIELLRSLEELKKNSILSKYFAKLESGYEMVKWVFGEINNFEGLKGLIVTFHEQYLDITLTALEAENKYRIPKTKFIYDTKKGILHLEQKMPITWHAFNETPKFDEIPEIKALGELRAYFSKSNQTLTSIYIDYKQYSDYADHIPPFNSRALVIGNKNYVTFDRKFYNFHGNCSYLLANDFINEKFSIFAMYDPKNPDTGPVFVVTVANETIILDFVNKVYKYTDDYEIKLPFSHKGVIMYQENDILTLKSRKGVGLKCNLKYEVCIFDLEGWYFGKTSGLLGTINNEPIDDFLTSKNEVVTSVQDFGNSWMLNDKQCQTVQPISKKVKTSSENLKHFCESLFENKMSPFQICFSRVPAKNFLKMCMDNFDRHDACAVAYGYIELCKSEKIELRIPDSCVKCKLLNGTEIPEGTFFEIRKSEISPPKSDIVFILEAKKCNENLRKRKNLDILISSLNQEFLGQNFKDLRYSLVTFGGPGIFDKPRSIIFENQQIFTDFSSFGNYFDNIPVGNGSSDIFEALDFASKLIFRPGVSKTFILLPCSRCQESDMKNLDYASVHQLLREYKISLHILMDGDFVFKKGTSRVKKQFFGIDQGRAYSKKDSKDFVGDLDLRKQVSVNKTILGVCAPLALETNGTVFSAKKLELGKKAGIKMFSSVFGKRVANTAGITECQTCECTSNEEGTSFVECFPCEYPGSSLIEDDFTDYEFLSNEEEEDMIIGDYTEGAEDSEEF